MTLTVPYNIIAIIVGMVFVAHGVPKLVRGGHHYGGPVAGALGVGWVEAARRGFPGTIEGFQRLGVPFPRLSALFAGVTQVVGGLLLMVGVLVPLASAMLGLNMVGAVTVKLKGGFLGATGFEYPLVLLACCTALFLQSL